ncbi:MAG: hypothetical protein K0S65_5086, partial [Labilithrix sp.]|nr:hypothetical protein [Labilithrix sp.]
MHCTRPRPERALVPAGLVAFAFLALHCSSEPSAHTIEPVTDAGSRDALDDVADRTVHEAGTLDAGPPIVCVEDEPCALGIVAPTAGSIVTWTSPRGIVSPLAEAFCVRLATGKVACWGDHREGHLGRPSVDGGTDAGSPGLVPGVENAVDLDRGCALLEGGAVSCWGPRSPLVEHEDIPFPAPVTLPIPLATKVRIGNDVGCAVLTTGALICWGTDTGSGQMAYASSSEPDGGPFRGP